MMAQISETEARLNSHEEVCKIRYESINARLKRIEQILMASAAFIMVTLGTIVFKLPH
jgi:D-alanyl-lipoteichoic acid acyltransferase DltB (MBOAT superfamily)